MKDQPFLMKRLAALTLLALAIPFSARAEVPMRVMVYGDNLTAGYQLQPQESFAARLKRALQGYGYTNVDVVGMSVPTDTSSSAVARIGAALAQPADVVIVELGANDMTRGVKPTAIYQNVWRVVTQFKQAGAYVILVGIKAPENLGKRYAAQMEADYRAIASENKIAFYPFALDGVAGKAELTLADGLSPNAEGVEVMAKYIAPLVDKGLRARWDQRQTPHGAPEPETPTFGAAPNATRRH